jgi:murein DD-endopeptidase MepM/ murein hydrolase activator NlpD
VHLHGADTSEGLAKEATPNAHRERSGKWAVYEQIPKLPERPAEYEAYRYPIPPGLPGGRYVVSGYDLDRPDALQRRGRTLSHVGHGGLDLPQTRGTSVALVALDHQQGEAEVLFAGKLFGTTVITRHAVREAGRVRDYIVLFGHLDSIAAGASPGASLPEGAPIGAVGDTGSPELVHLHLEVRRVREGVDLTKIAGGGNLIAESVSVVCDPRNVLQLK